MINKNNMENFVEIITCLVEQSPNQKIFTFIDNGNEVSITYSELDAKAQAIASRLIHLGLSGKPVMLLYPAGIDYIYAFLGCLYANAIAIPAYPPFTATMAARLQNIINDSEAKAVLTNAYVKNKLTKLTQLKAIINIPWLSYLLPSRFEELKIINYININKLLWINSSEIDLQEQKKIIPKPDQVAFLQYTSGSTGAPKGVIVSHQNLVANAKMIEIGLELNSDMRLVSWLPPYHDMGLMGGILQPIYSNIYTILFSPLAFIKNPFLWLETISRYHATVSGGPNFSYSHSTKKISTDQLQKLNLSSWQLAFNGAEPINQKTIEAFTKKFEPCGFKKETFRCCYGLAEVTLFVSITKSGNPPSYVYVDKISFTKSKIKVMTEKNENSLPLVSSGALAEGMKIQIVNPETNQTCSIEQIGEVWLSGDNVTKGYWHKENINKEIFNAYTKDGQGPFLRTGDLGFIYKNEIYITGRMKDIIIIRGRNYYPHDVENIVENSHTAIKIGSCLAFSIEEDEREKLVVVCEVEKENDEIILAIREKVLEELGVEIEQLVLLNKKQDFKTSSGKKQRLACKKAFLAGELHYIRLWKNTQIKLNNEIEDNYEVSPSIIFPSQKNDSRQSSDQLINWLKEYASSRINSFIMDERRCISPHILLDFGNHGLFGLQIHKKDGGLGFNHTESMKVFEQVAAINLSLGIFVGLSNANIKPIESYATSSIRAEYLPQLASGRGLAALALTEPQAGSNIHQIKTTAQQIYRHYEINGIKIWSGSAAWSSIITTFCRSIDTHNRYLGITGFAIPSSLPGVKQSEEAITMGLRSMVQNKIIFEHAKVNADYMLGEVGQGIMIAENILMYTRLGLASVSLGAMKHCAQITYNYLNNREISTGSMLENTIIIEKMNSVNVAIDSIEILLRHCCKLLDDGKKPSPELAIACKVLSTEFLWNSVDTCMQLLGGRGYIETNIVPQIMRDARIMRIFEGANEVLLDYLGALLLAKKDKDYAFLDELDKTKQYSGKICDLVMRITSKQITMEKLDKNLSLIKYRLGLLTIYTILFCVVRNIGHAETIAWCEQQYQYYYDRLLKIINDKEKIPTSALLKTFDKKLKQELKDVQENMDGFAQQMDPWIQSDFIKNDGTETINMTTNVIDQKKKTELINWIINWLKIHGMGGCKNISAEMKFTQLGMDSVNAVALIADLEAYLQQNLPTELLYEYETIEHIADYLASASFEHHQDISEKVAISHENIANWISPFLDYGYQQEAIQFTDTKCNSQQAIGKFNVVDYFMPSDGVFHVNIFNAKIALLQLFTIFCEQNISQKIISIVPIYINQEYIKPIRNHVDIPIQFTIKNKRIEGDLTYFDILFEMNGESFIGNASFVVKTESNIQLHDKKLTPSIPNECKYFYRDTEYKLHNIEVNNHSLNAKVTSKTLNVDSSLDLIKQNYLASIYISQLAVIYACWITKMPKKNSEFYLFKLNEKVNISPNSLQANNHHVSLKIIKKIKTAQSTILTIAFYVDDGTIIGEASFAIPKNKVEIKVEI